MGDRPIWRTESLKLFQIHIRQNFGKSSNVMQLGWRTFFSSDGRSHRKDPFHCTYQYSWKDKHIELAYM